MKINFSKKNLKMMFFFTKIFVFKLNADNLITDLAINNITMINIILLPHTIIQFS